MKGQIGSKHYNTETADLVDTLPNGFLVYRKRGRSYGECFLYNPKGKTVKECFFPLSPKDSEKYMTPQEESNKTVFKNGATVVFSKHDRDRIKRHALHERMSMTQFILMLVDRYEQDRSH